MRCVVEQTSLFPEQPEAIEGSATAPTRPEEARVVRPVRNQVQLVMQDLDGTLPEGHQARAVWAFVERLDLTPLYASIQAVQGGPGRPASDPSA